MDDGQHAAAPRRNPWALTAAAGVAGLALGVTGVASAQTSTPTPGPVGERGRDDPARRLPAGRPRRAGAGGGSSSSFTPPEATSDEV